MATIDYKVYLREDDPQDLFEIVEEIGQGSFGFVYKVKRILLFSCTYFNSIQFKSMMTISGSPQGDG